MSTGVWLSYYSVLVLVTGVWSKGTYKGLPAHFSCSLPLCTWAHLPACSPCVSSYGHMPAHCPLVYLPRGKLPHSINSRTPILFCHFFFDYDNMTKIGLSIQPLSKKAPWWINLCDWRNERLIPWWVWNSQVVYTITSLY